MSVCVCVCSYICKKYRHVAVTVPRVRHLVICTHRVPPGKDMCFSWVLTGVSVLHAENVFGCYWCVGDDEKNNFECHEAIEDQEGQDSASHECGEGSRECGAGRGSHSPCPQLAGRVWQRKDDNTLGC